MEILQSTWALQVSIARTGSSSRSTLELHTQVPLIAFVTVVASLTFGQSLIGLVSLSVTMTTSVVKFLLLTCYVGLEGRTQPKVPTAILYDPQDSTKFKWGGQLTWRDDHVQGVKLLLDPKQTRPSYLPSSSAKREMRRLPKDVVDVVADFMAAMYKHALEKIGARVPRDYLDLCEKSFVLSVPAVWSDKAKERTIQVLITAYQSLPVLGDS